MYALYGHLVMHSDHNKRPRVDGGRFGSTRGGKVHGGRGRDGDRVPHAAGGQAGGHVPADRMYLSFATKEWYKSNHRCFKCGSADHTVWKCNANAPRLAADLPALLKVECEQRQA